MIPLVMRYLPYTWKLLLEPLLPHYFPDNVIIALEVRLTFNDCEPRWDRHVGVRYLFFMLYWTSSLFPQSSQKLCVLDH